MMISHLLQVGYVCYYLAKSNYSMNTISLQWKEIGFKYVESEHLLANWNTLFNKSIANWFIFTKVNILHFLAIKKKGRKSWEYSESLSLQSWAQCIFLFWWDQLGRTHARTGGQWLTLQMFGNRNRQEWEVWEGIFLLHLSKPVYVQYCSSVRPHTAGYINGFSAPAHSSVSVGSPQVNKLEMYVFSKWPPYASHIQLEKSYSTCSQSSVNSVYVLLFCISDWSLVPVQWEVNSNGVQWKVRLGIWSVVDKHSHLGISSVSQMIIKI